MLLVMRALNRAPAGINWWTITGSNRSPPECKSDALPNELMALKITSGDDGAMDPDDNARGRYQHQCSTVLWGRDKKEQRNKF